MSKSDWKRGASESRQQIELLRARWPKAFPAKGHEVRPLANAASAIAEALGWSAAHDDAALRRVADRLDVGMRERLNALLADADEGTGFARLAADPGRVGLESLLAEITKLERLRALGLPPDLLRGAHPEQIKRFRRRAAIETAWELRRHPERIRLPLLAFWCVPRQAEVIDGLVELLIQVTHRVTVKAERRTLEELVEEAVEVRGKAGILLRVAEAAVGSPEGVVREVIFPAAGQSTLEALAREARALARGLTPLIWGHVNPYGVFDLDMERRLDLDPAEAA